MMKCFDEKKSFDKVLCEVLVKEMVLTRKDCYSLKYLSYTCFIKILNTWW